MAKSLLFLIIGLAATATVGAQAPTAFTYQGQLLDGGVAAGGSYDFEFGLFDSQIDGAALADPWAVDDWPVVAGEFTVNIDFGPGAFAGGESWLEIRVRAGDSTGAYAVLSPRQRISPTPLALHAFSVEAGAIEQDQLANDAVASLQIVDGSIQAVDVDLAQLQARIDPGCGAGASIRTINQDGTVECEPDDDSGGDITAVIAGPGLLGGAETDAATLELDFAAVQSAVSGQCETGTVLVGINPDGSLVCEVMPIGLEFIADDPVDARVGLYTSIAVRPDDRPIVSYYDETNGDLKIYSCANAVCSAGTARSVAGVGGFDVGQYSSMAIRDDGLPIVSYYDTTNGWLKIYDCLDADCASGTTRTPDTGGGNDVGQFSSIAVRPNGLPIVAYYDATAGDLKAFDCSDSGCSSGTVRILDDGGAETRGSGSSLAIRLSGRPLISYNDDSNDRVMVYDCADVNCASGTPRVLWSSASEFEFLGALATAVRHDGFPLILISRAILGGSSTTHVFRCLDFGCETGGSFKVADFASGRASMAIRSAPPHGRPIAALTRAASPTLLVLDCIHVNCSVSAVRTPAVANFGEVGEYAAIAIRANDLPVLSYYNEASGSLMVFSCGDYNCLR